MTDKREAYLKQAEESAKKQPRKVSARTARITIGMMRSIASGKTINPFLLYAAEQMERLLNEVVEARKK